ncbi:ABC transporter substrate-binding protein [Actinokineospora sp. UTMC 2448]|uniref:ABC transporter substrate-binding protein n=1 Tax=Actinokineospora sp. UTMC 2448 TaxID=2268449 RepID=UPI0021648AE9|nr:ABC transporter substrate-binding protein [Actinokineospora sp. UTMC 2448]UVS80527.1 Glutathione-binding protein GsiB precursor [Actinokineospora sp. UTMC 2448]
MRIRRFPTAGSAGVVAAALVLAGCAGAGGAAGQSDPTLDIATMTFPQSLDPVTAIGGALPFFQAAYDSLVKREPDGAYSPMLATGWTWDTDRTKLSLTLRDDVRFDDGTPFDAAAVKANLERFKASSGANAKWLSGLERVEVVDATRVVLHLDAPDPAYLYYLSDAAGLMANPAAFADAERLKTTPDGTGPYELDAAQTVVGTKWVYRRADDYWGERLPFDGVTMTVFDNETAIVNGLKTGQIDTAVVQDANQQASLEGATTLTTTPVDFDYQGILLFDRAGVVTPELADVRVRQALNHAIDRKTMLEQIRRGKGAVTSQVFGADTVAYDESLDSYYAHDPEKAKRLLAEAGHADGFELKMPRMTSIVSDAIDASLQSDLADVGITLTWVDVDQGDALRRIFQDREFSGFVMNNGQPATDWLAIKDLVLPGTFNVFGYTDETVRSLVPKIQAAQAEDALDELRALNRHLVEDAWFVPFYRMTYALVTDGGVTALPQSGMAVPSLYNYQPTG